MAKKRTNTLSDKGVRDFNEMRRRVLRKGLDISCTPYNRGKSRRNDGAKVVRVKQQGGSAGSDGVEPDWTYKIYSPNTLIADIEADTATPIAVQVSVVSRLIAVEHDAAADGTLAIAAWDDEENEYKIISGTIAEKVVTASCTEAPAFGY